MSAETQEMKAAKETKAAKEAEETKAAKEAKEAKKVREAKKAREAKVCRKMNDRKAFRLGILVGRFQTLHTGHEQIIEKAIELCDEVGIFVGSSQESGTWKNPFPYETRRELLENVFGDRVKIFPLPDVGLGNVPAWGDYVLRNVKDRFGAYPDLLVSGKEERRLDWFDNARGLAISELYVPKSIDISASRMRELFVLDDETAWREYVNPANYHKYGELRQMALSAKDITETASV